MSCFPHRRLSTTPRRFFEVHAGGTPTSRSSQRYVPLVCLALTRHERARTRSSRSRAAPSTGPAPTPTSPEVLPSNAADCRCPSRPPGDEHHPASRPSAQTIPARRCRTRDRPDPNIRIGSTTRSTPFDQVREHRCPGVATALNHRPRDEQEQHRRRHGPKRSTGGEGTTSSPPEPRNTTPTGPGTHPRRAPARRTALPAEGTTSTVVPPRAIRHQMRTPPRDPGKGFTSVDDTHATPIRSELGFPSNRVYLVHYGEVVVEIVT